MIWAGPPQCGVGVGGAADREHGGEPTGAPPGSPTRGSPRSITTAAHRVPRTPRSRRPSIRNPHEYPSQNGDTAALEGQPGLPSDDQKRRRHHRRRQESRRRKPHSSSAAVSSKSPQRRGNRKTDQRGDTGTGNGGRHQKRRAHPPRRHAGIRCIGGCLDGGVRGEEISDDQRHGQHDQRHPQVLRDDDSAFVGAELLSDSGSPVATAARSCLTPWSLGRRHDDAPTRHRRPPTAPRWPRRSRPLRASGSLTPTVSLAVSTARW